MKSFLFLILSLMTGCEAYDVFGCKDGWVEFTCELKNNKKVEVKLVNQRRPFQSTKVNVWENQGRVSLYHNKKDKRLKVAIKQLELKDSGEYECKGFGSSSEEDEQQGRVHVAYRCQEPLVQTAYETGTTTITCVYPKKIKAKTPGFCKENQSTCKDVISAESSEGTFHLKKNSEGFNVTIINVSSHHAGVYWCGVSDGLYRASLRRIKLEVKGITTSKRPPTAGPDSPPSPSTPSVTSLTSRYPVTASSMSSTQSAAAGSDDGLLATLIICLAVLLLVLILVLVVKRFRFSKNGAQSEKEDATYEEIQDRPQQPESGTAVKTVYATANFPTNMPSASHHHPNINSQSSSDAAGGDNYSTVTDRDPPPTYSTVNHPEDPYYSTVKQQQ